MAGVAMKLKWVLLVIWVSVSALAAETVEKSPAPPAAPQAVAPAPTAAPQTAVPASPIAPQAVVPDPAQALVPAASSSVPSAFAPPPAGAMDDALSDDDEDDDDDDSDDELSSAQAHAMVADEDGDEDDDEADPRTISGNVTLASDYILRGLSQTDHQPAMQGGFDWNHPAGIYLGVWGSNVRYADSVASLELDFSGGYTHDFSESLSASLGLLYLVYYGDMNRNSLDIPFKIQWKAFQVEFDYSPGWEGDGQAGYLSAGWSDQVIWGVKAGLFAGSSLFSDGLEGSNYADFRASLSREFLDVEWAVNGIFLNQQEINGAPGGTQLVVSVSKAF
jgi:uncharacterized protein (TIGR02001 family)